MVTLGIDLGLVEFLYFYILRIILFGSVSICIITL